MDEHEAKNFIFLNKNLQFPRLFPYLNHCFILLKKLPSPHDKELCNIISLFPLSFPTVDCILVKIDYSDMLRTITCRVWVDVDSWRTKLSLWLPVRPRSIKSGILAKVQLTVITLGLQLSFLSPWKYNLEWDTFQLM